MVGTLVGLTGIGGGSLLTPLLILVVGVRPAIAVGTDLAFAAVTKAVGAASFLRRSAADTRLTLQLACGSLPGTLIGARLIDAGPLLGLASPDELVRHALGVALCLAGGASIVRAAGWSIGRRVSTAPGPLASAAVGFAVGVLVGLTSVGAGAVLMAVFTVLYSLPPARAVGTDVVHGALLAAVAAALHGASGRVELPLLVSLLAGSLPGVALGSWLCGRVPGRPLRLGVGVMLIVSGLRLL